MRDAVVKYGMFYGALLVVGVVAWKLTRAAVDPAGGHGTSLLNSASPALSAAVGVAAVLLAAATGFAAGKLVSARGGLLDMGAVLGWGAFGMGTLRQIVMAKADSAAGAGTRAVLTNLTIEAVVVGALVVGAAWLIERTARSAGRDHDAVEDKGAAGVLTTVACGMAGCAAGVWLIGQTGYKGQVIGSALVGGVLGAIIAYAVDHRARLWALTAGCLLVTVGGPVIALATGGGDALLYRAVVDGSVARWAQLTGLDGAAGICLGIPVGLYAAKGLLGHAGRVAEDAA